jgi:hypothetical protein
VKTVDLTISLESLSFFLAQPGPVRVTNSARTSETKNPQTRRTREL